MDSLKVSAMVKKILLVLIIPFLSLSCIRKVIDYQGTVSVSKPFKIKVSYYENVMGQKIAKTNYFADLLVIALKNHEGSRIVIVEENYDLEIVFSDNINYASARILDKRGEIRFVTVYSHLLGSYASMNETDMRSLVDKTAADMTEWLEKQ
jgi:hypothetical protein